MLNEVKKRPMHGSATVLMKKPATRVRYLLDNDEKELVESFYRDLEFGTGGLRGIMGAGTNRMNIYTVGMATQGLSNYIRKQFKGQIGDQSSGWP